jgi:predicted dehydrogenase
MARAADRSGRRPRVSVYELSLGLTPVDGNPHFWLDPSSAVRYAQRVAQGLGEHDLDGADQYWANVEQYIGEIQTFDDWAKGQIAEIPASRHKLVTFHDAYPISRLILASNSSASSSGAPARSRHHRNLPTSSTRSKPRTSL